MLMSIVSVEDKREFCKYGVDCGTEWVGVVQQTRTCLTTAIMACLLMSLLCRWCMCHAAKH